MSISKERTVRIDGVKYDNWKKAEELFKRDEVWYTVSNNEDGYNLVDACGNNPYNALLTSGLLTKKEVAICENEIKPDNFLVIFD